MKKFNRLLALSLALCSSLVASNIEVERVGLHIGTAHTTSSQENKEGEIILGKEPKKNFAPSVEVYGTLSGVFEDKAVEPFLSYTYSNNSDLTHQYILVGVNKYYSHNTYKAYAGIYTGYSFLKWEYNPLNNTTNNNFTSSSLLVGAQVGWEYPLANNLSLDLNFKGMLYDHSTILEASSAKAEIENKLNFSAGLGLVYKF